MTLTKRLIPCLDVDKGKVVKGVRFVNIRDVGDPVEHARYYSNEGADELVFLDITASAEGRKTMRDVVERVADAISIPFTVGGGIGNVEDAQALLLKGADKVSVNTAAIKNPRIVSELAERYGSQCVVVAIDAKRNFTGLEGKRFFEEKDNRFWYEAYIYGGRKSTSIDAVEWAEKVEELGAGELLVTSMDRDGTKDGYDIPLTRGISRAVNIPVIASGGAGHPKHLLEALVEGEADAALAASIFHFREYKIAEVKRFLAERGVPVRLDI